MSSKFANPNRGRSSGGMSAKDQRQLLGIIFIVIGLIVLFIGVGNGEADYSRLNSTQLASRAVYELLLPDFTEIGVGFILLLVGLIIFFAPSNKAASRGIRNILPH